MAFGSPQYAKISAASNGNNTIVVAVTGQRIIVLGYVLVATTAVAVQWQDGSSTAISGAMPLGVTGVLSVPQGAADEGYMFGQFQTSGGNALVLNLSSAVQVSGHLVYVLQAAP